MRCKSCRQCPLESQGNTRLQCVSLSLITLLVFTTLVISTVLAYNPILLLNIAQIKTGERDFILKPKTHNFNATKIRQLTQLIPLPRFHADLVVGEGKRASGWLMDFDLEKQQGLGSLGAGLGKDHRFVYAHRSLGLVEGEEVNVQLEDSDAWDIILQLAANKTLQPEGQKGVYQKIKFQLKGTFPQSTFIVREVFDDSRGKMGSEQANGCIFLDINTAIQQMVGQSFPDSTLTRLMAQPTFTLAEIATEAAINLPNRIQIYNSPDTQEVLRTIQSYGQEIALNLGFFAIGMEMPISVELQTLQYFGMFIGVMLKAIIASLFLLSVLMLDSTLQTGLDKQKADMAILKVVGANRLHVAGHVLGGAVRQVLLANLIAYPLTFLAFSFIESTAIELIGHKIEVAFTFEACAAAAFIGLLVPIIASLSPIKGLIDSGLTDSLGQGKLNYAQTKTQIYVEGQEFPWGKVTFGVMATTYGLAIYYLLPKAMINTNLGLMITLFFLFLEGLMVGLVILSYSFEYLLQQIMARVLLFWTDYTDFSLTVKNLSCHRLSNRKTSLIYALAVSFIIMIAVGFQLQIDAVRDEYFSMMGCDIDIGGPFVNATFINSLLPQLPEVDTLTFITENLQVYLTSRGEQVLISDKAKLFFLQSSIYGVGGPFLHKDDRNGREVVYSEAYAPYNIYTYLQSEAGQDTCTISEYVARRFGILHSQSHELLINLYHKDRVRRVPINYSSVLNKRKGVFYSYLSIIRPEMAVSLETYKQLAGIQNHELPINRAKIYVKDYSKLTQIGAIIRQQARKAGEFPHNIDFLWDRSQTDQIFRKMQRMLDAIMMTLLGLVLVLCFFSLLTTTHGNIRGQQREIGVLMVLGYDKGRIMKIYVYEAFVLMTNSCLKGFAVGYVMAALMGLQRDLFSSVPVNISFRAEYLAIIFVFAAGSSLLATYGALKETLSLKISDLLSSYN